MARFLIDRLNQEEIATRWGYSGAATGHLAKRRLGMGMDVHSALRCGYCRQPLHRIADRDVMHALCVVTAWQ